MRRVVIVCLVLILIASCALAESTVGNEVANDTKETIITTPGTEEKAIVYARVTTKKGGLNVRKEGKAKARLVVTVPNKAIVIVEEKGEEWSLVSYNQKTGYAMTEFLSIYEGLPFTEWKLGDSDNDIMTMKKALKKLGYYAKDAVVINNEYDEATQRAVERFAASNNMGMITSATKELQELLLWGSPTKYAPATEPEEVEAENGFKCKISASIYGHEKQSNGNVTMKCKYSTSITGGKEPYKVKVRKIEETMTEATAPYVEGSPFSHTWYAGSTEESFKLTLVVTDADGITVTATTRCSLNIPFDMMYDNTDTDTDVETDVDTGEEIDYEQYY